MSEFSDPPGTDSRSRIRQLASSMADGRAYDRWKDIDRAIGRLSRLHQSDLIEEAKHMPNEAVVYFIKQTHRAEQGLCGALLLELSKRTLRIMRPWLLGLDEGAAESIVVKVETAIQELVLSEQSSRQSDFLEIAFAMAVKQRTLDAINKHKKSPMGLLAELPRTGDEDGDDSEEIERPIELVPDNRPGAEAITIRLQHDALARKIIERAYTIAADRRHVDAAVLHYGYGWAISSKTGKENLMSYFPARPAQLKYWIPQGAKALEAAAEYFFPSQERAATRPLEEASDE